MQKPIIGYMACPTCRDDDAEVKEDKNGHAFLFCPGCATQVFTRNPHRDRHMRKNMRPVTVTDTDPETAPPVTAPTPTPAPPAPTKKTGWFTPLLGSEEQ